MARGVEATEVYGTVMRIVLAGEEGWIEAAVLTRADGAGEDFLAGGGERAVLAFP